MPIDVRWEAMDWEAAEANPRAPAPTRLLDFVLDNDLLLERALSDSVPPEEFPYLRSISHETVTVFHQQYLTQLITELEALSRRSEDPEVAKHLNAVSQLVLAACGERDTLVRFEVRAG